MSKCDQLPSWRFVALLGVDGSGKTTIAQLLQMSWGRRGWTSHHFHGRPTILGSPRRLIGQKPTCDPTRPHAVRPHVALISLALLFYYYIDALLCYRFAILPRTRKSVVLYERYFYDLVFDPVRHRLSPSTMPLARFLARFAPRPDLIVVLHGEADVLVARKAEITPDSINAQQRAMFSFFEGAEAGFVPIDVTHMSPDDVVAAITAAANSVVDCAPEGKTACA